MDFRYYPGPECTPGSRFRQAAGDRRGNMKVIIAALAGAAVVAVAAAGYGQVKRDPTLDKLAVQFEAAFNARDAAKAAAMYANDAILMPPNRSMVRGRANIEAY